EDLLRKITWILGIALSLALGCPTVDDDDSAGDDDTTGDDDDACDPLAPGALATWEGAGPLDVGDVAELTFDEGEVSFTLDGDGGDYLAVVISLSQQNDTTYPLEVEGGAAAIAPPPTVDPSAPPVFEPPRVEDPVPVPDPIGDSSVPEVGDIRTFEVYGMLGAFEVEAEALAVSDSVIVYMDITTEHDLPALDEDYIADSLELFEGIVLPRERFFFHQEPDVNEDGHISLLFSYTVNAQGIVAYVTQCDLQPQDVCGYGNEQEVIYANIPDPEGNYYEPHALAELLAHEFNHTIYFASKYLDNDAVDVDENVYITEGMSALAQDLSGYNNGNQYVWGMMLDDIPNASMTDVYVKEPGTHYYGQRDGTLRGVGASSMRYLYDRFGPEVGHDDGTFDVTCGVEYLHDWFATPEAGLDAVLETTELEADTFFADYWTALGVHQQVDEGVAADPAYHFQPQVEDPLTGYMRGIDLYTTIHGWLELSGPMSSSLEGSSDHDLRSGGAVYLLAEGLDEELTVSLSTDDSARAIVRMIRLD
ncbi:MAG: hypothetical protein QGH45_23885, partial [Myxococcota bacterium]|nr:hypothetical protein [Myxococcota bacterium]